MIAHLLPLETVRVKAPSAEFLTLVWESYFAGDTNLTARLGFLVEQATKVNTILLREIFLLRNTFTEDRIPTS
jgi:hypothetical protein